MSLLLVTRFILYLFSLLYKTISTSPSSIFSTSPSSTSSNISSPLTPLGVTGLQPTKGKVAKVIITNTTNNYFFVFYLLSFIKIPLLFNFRLKKNLRVSLRTWFESSISPPLAGITNQHLAEKTKKPAAWQSSHFKCFRPITLRTILSDSLPLSTFEDVYSIFEYTYLYLFYSLKESILDINLRFF